MGRTLAANHRLACSACGKRHVARPLNSIVRQLFAMVWDAIIFDCDGTLVDSEPLGNEVLAECAKEFGVSIDGPEALRRFRGLKMAECVQQLESLRGSALPESFVSELRARTAAAFASRLRAVDGAAEIVRSLRVPYCVASSGPREKIELSLSVVGLLSYFEGKIFSSYEVGHWKPDPGIFLYAAAAMKIQPQSCAVVEDSLPGIHAGVAAGMTVFALESQACPEALPSEVKVIRSLGELHQIFRNATIAV